MVRGAYCVMPVEQIVVLLVSTREFGYPSFIYLPYLPSYDVPVYMLGILRKLDKV